jgi:hypothetical protein
MVAKKIPLAAIIVLVTIMLFSIPGAGLGPSPASAQGQQLEGAWVVTVTVPGQPSVTALHTYTRDGGVLVSSSSMQRSVGHGAWVRTGNREFGRTWVQLRFDEKGAFAGTSKVRSIIRLSETSDEWVGVAVTVDVFDPTGKQVSSTTGGVMDQAKRIRVEAP